MRRGVDLRLYAVLDPERCGGRDPVELAKIAAANGATLLQLRDKRGCTRECVDLARRVVEALKGSGVPVLVNDRVDVAMAAHARGVHLGQDDMSPADARRLMGPDALIGVTVHHDHEADAVEQHCADYAGLGPTYQTSSKNPEDPPVGPEGIAALVGRLQDRLPHFQTCAIAGITRGNAAEVIRVGGVDGVAVISDLFMAEDVAKAARGLRDTVDAALQERKGGTA